MSTFYLSYDFDSDTVVYPTGYDSTKLNLGSLMTRNYDDNGDVYVCPLEPRFLRGYEVLKVAPYSYANRMNSLGSFNYGTNKIWLFYAGSDSQGTVPKRVFLSEFNISSNEFSMVGSVEINMVSNSAHGCHSLEPSMEYHTGGTVGVTGTSVVGSGTTWMTDGVCVGNRIGFGSTNSQNITTWYGISAVNSNTSLTIRKEFPSDGDTFGLSISAGTQYVIEDLRIIYVDFGGGTTSVIGIALAKGLRYEIFTLLPTSIPAATTIDNIRACYRILDSTGTTATFQPLGQVLEEKTSFTSQTLYTMSYLSATNVSMQKFNIRAPLTVTAGRSNSPFMLTTGSQAHGGTNNAGSKRMTQDYSGNLYITNYTRISRIPTSAITASSTTFIVDAMVENPPGTSTTYPLSSQLLNGMYMRNINRFYISHSQGTIRDYITPYVVGGQFTFPVNVNDQNLSNTYLVSEFDNLLSNFNTNNTGTQYQDGIMFFYRNVTSDENVIMTFPWTADKTYESLSNSCIITPELQTTSATSYNRVYFEFDSFFNTDIRFYYPRENFDVYYRTSGITADTGTWVSIPQTGEISGNSSSIQFKITFKTIGLYSIPARLRSIVLSYEGTDIPDPLTFYEPSLKQTDIASQIFSWRQNSLFVDDIPELNIDIYDSSNNLLLTDTVSGSTGGVWQYSSDDGSTWNSFQYTANTVGNYIRYSATTLSASGLIVKPIIYV